MTRDGILAPVLPHLVIEYHIDRRERRYELKGAVGGSRWHVTSTEAVRRAAQLAPAATLSFVNCHDPRQNARSRRADKSAPHHD